MEKATVMFRFVPTMRCNFRCEYCFVDNREKTGGKTMFDDHPVSEWVNAMRKFDSYNVELYFWGGEPFCLDETYELLREWTLMDHIISGIRIDTNVFFAEKIAKLCPSKKIKLNCSYHMQYHTLEDEFRKVKLLKELNMVGMLNFVASQYNLTHLRTDYGMTVADLIEKFKEIDVFVNVAGDFAYANHPNYERYEEYRKFILQFIPPEEWDWLRGIHSGRRLCTAGQKMFTVEYDGTFTSCIDKKSRGNFFDGILSADKEPGYCERECPSLVSYPFRCDNDYPSVNSLLAYVGRAKAYREANQEPFFDFIFE